MLLGACIDQDAGTRRQLRRKYLWLMIFLDSGRIDPLVSLSPPVRTYPHVPFPHRAREKGI